MKIKVKNAAGPTLNWLVAKCEGSAAWLLVPAQFAIEQQNLRLRYSNDWALGGPIIEREIICIEYAYKGRWLAANRTADDDYTGPVIVGPTFLIAAMRCYCCRKLGAEVEVPDELA